MMSNSLPGRVLVWDAATGEQRQGLEGPGEAVNWLQWHPRGNVLLAGSEDFTAWLWNAQTSACMHVRCHLTPDIWKQSAFGTLPAHATGQQRPTIRCMD